MNWLNGRRADWPTKSLATLAEALECERLAASRVKAPYSSAPLAMICPLGRRLFEYLLHSFYSPLGNDRTDAYGGSRKNRMRLILEVAEAVRSEWPADKPLFVRLSCIDGEDGGWSIEDTVALSTELVARGVDLIDCSSRGIGLSPTARVLSRIPGFQVPFADRVRREASVPSMAVGLILTGHQAESILSDGRADLICIAREALRNPHWALHAVRELGGDPEWAFWPPQYGWWLSRRAGQLRLGEKDISEGRITAIFNR